ncbi:hypothetical protein EDC96DRAFT_543325 [Choanephora cucurbitarum]|nr:hypothetical protein EDC96DRAFT_543325 [Choanephora cucurbitarum]
MHCVTGALLNYICKKFVNIQRFELVQHGNNSKMKYNIPAKTFKRFASYLNNMAYFEIAFSKLRSNTNSQKKILNDEYTCVWKSKSEAHREHILKISQIIHMLNKIVASLVGLSGYAGLSLLYHCTYSQLDPPYSK